MRLADELVELSDGATGSCQQAGDAQFWRRGRRDASEN